MQCRSSFVVTALLGLCALAGAAPTNQPTNQPTKIASQPLVSLSVSLPARSASLACLASTDPLRPQVPANCVREDTAQNGFASDCGDYDSYELGFDDSQGYHDDGPDIQIAGCVGGHNECDDGCQYENLSIVSAPAPQFQIDQFDGSVQWATYYETHSQSTCSSECYTETNEAEFGGYTGLDFYSCVY